MPKPPLANAGGGAGADAYPAVKPAAGESSGDGVGDGEADLTPAQVVVVVGEPAGCRCGRCGSGTEAIPRLRQKSAWFFCTRVVTLLLMDKQRDQPRAEEPLVVGDAHGDGDHARICLVLVLVGGSASYGMAGAARPNPSAPGRRCRGARADRHCVGLGYA